jgi:hypothetical protein
MNCPVCSHDESRVLRTTGDRRVLPTPSRRKAQLTSMEGVRCEMARIYREMESAKRDSQDGSRLVYVLTQIAKVLEFTEIERRLIVLEARNAR